MNPFLFPASEYVRDIDIKKGYIQHTAKYLSLQLKKPFSECLEFVRSKTGRGQTFEFRDPAMDYLYKKGPGHRVKDETTFLGYIDEVIETNRIMSPSMTVYERPEIERSMTAGWLETNIAARKKAKKNMLVFKQRGELVKSQLEDYNQNSRKIRINSVSGMRGFKGCPLFLATGHSSLTSFCRAAAGYGNATVERFITGSRHYHTAEIAKANFAAVLCMESPDRFIPIMDKYGLVYPTVDDVCEMIRHSTSLYLPPSAEDDSIRKMVEGATEIERAIFCYSGDLYHLAKHNPEVVRKIISDLIVLDISDVGDVVTEDELKGMDATDIAYVNALCADVLMGSTHDEVKVKNPEGWQKVGKTARKFKQVFSEYGDFINTFFATKHLPPTVASLKAVQRRAALAADTDSSIFTTEYWIGWYCGEIKRGYVEDRIWYLITYMACQCIAHSLATFSKNIGVGDDRIFELAMKNEYGFPVFALTNLAKHYFSFMSMREGMVYEKMENEIKGVELRGSTAPKHILKATESLMTDILSAANDGRKLKASEVLERVAGYELDTVRSILRGEYTYLRSDSIKPNTKKVCYHELWQDVFAPKYGATVEPPYPCVKVSTELVNKTSLKEWLENIQDEGIKERMVKWLIKYNRQDLKTIILPTQAIKASGLPVEIQEAANVRKLAYQINSGFYRILESTGLFIVDRNHHRLVYDFLGLKP